MLMNNLCDSLRSSMPTGALTREEPTRHRSARRKNTMIKEIKVPTWPEIEKAVAALPPEKRKKYITLKGEYEKETSKPQPNHEKISSLIREANELLSTFSVLTL